MIFYIFFSQIFFRYIKMSQKSLVKDIKILLKKKKTKTENMVMNDQNLSETEKQRLLEYRKKYYEK